MDSTETQQRIDAINGHLIAAEDSSSLLRLNPTAGEFISGTTRLILWIYLYVCVCIYTCVCVCARVFFTWQVEIFCFSTLDILFGFCYGNNTITLHKGIAFRSLGLRFCFSNWLWICLLVYHILMFSASISLLTMIQ